MWSTTGEEKKNVCCFDVSSLCENRKNRVTESHSQKSSSFCRHGGQRRRFARREKTETQRGRPTARAPVRDEYAPVFLFLVSKNNNNEHKTPAFYFSLASSRMSHCLFPCLSLPLSLSLLVHQMAPSIRAAKVFGNLAKVNERAILGAEVTPGLCQARNI